MGYNRVEGKDPYFKLSNFPQIQLIDQFLYFWIITTDVITRFSWDWEPDESRFSRGRNGLGIRPATSAFRWPCRLAGCGISSSGDQWGEPSTMGSGPDGEPPMMGDWYRWRAAGAVMG
ncbi:hypothetical protein RHMOL_Rhmol09G0051100 [Rhododendron molle]|uniref:Uncharacterized protein n=1 Tax=Rhododendron molle TaxID=49168 RepID=A0ACC0MBU1_RHOML|nr:hypothetical protein RHMOL_Rhmol09G0051100 [Rhododendron molle]